MSNNNKNNKIPNMDQDKVETLEIQKRIVDSDRSVGRQNKMYQHERINKIDCNDLYAINNCNTASYWTPSHSSSEK